MFDRNDPADLLALKNEVNNDPITMGYASVIQSTQQLLNKLNDPAENVGGETTGETFTPRLILEVTTPNDLTPGGQFTEGEQMWIRLLMESTSGLDDNLDEFKQKFIDVFPNNASTLTALALKIRSLSRAEVLFGENTQISREDWLAARDS